MKNTYSARPIFKSTVWEGISEHGCSQGPRYFASGSGSHLATDLNNELNTNQSCVRSRNNTACTHSTHEQSSVGRSCGLSRSRQAFSYCRTLLKRGREASQKLCLLPHGIPSCLAPSLPMPPSLPSSMSMWAPGRTSFNLPKPLPPPAHFNYPKFRCLSTMIGLARRRRGRGRSEIHTMLPQTHLHLGTRITT